MGRRREEISLLSSRARALLRFDAYTCVGFFYGTTRVLYCFVFLSLVLIYYIAALYSSFFSRSKETVVSKPISSLFDFLSFTKKTRSSSRRRRAWCSLRLLFLLFLFCLFVVGLQTSSFHSFRPFHRRQKDPFSNDRHAFEPRTFLPRPMRQSFPPLAQREEEERHHALQRHAAAPEAHDRHSSSSYASSSSSPLFFFVFFFVFFFFFFKVVSKLLLKRIARFHHQKT